jgi:hypothetical protein
MELSLHVEVELWRFGCNSDKMYCFCLLINSELDTLRQRNKILKIADRHGWDTVNEYLDDPLADNNEDASKLRGQRIIKVLVNSVPTMAVCNFEYFVALAKSVKFRINQCSGIVKLALRNQLPRVKKVP